MPSAIIFSTVRKLTLSALAVALRSTNRILDSEGSVIITKRIVTAQGREKELRQYCDNFLKITSKLAGTRWMSHL